MPHRLALTVALAAAMPLAAQAMVGGDATPSGAPLTTTWYVTADPAAQAADRAYIAGMRPHHAGALSMSREYLADPGRSSPLMQALARTIIANQEFEIGVLDAVAADLDRPPLRLPFGIALQPVATEGLGDRQRFFKAPVPSAAAWPVAPMSERDVLFAKAMIIHHEGALEMARAYHANPAARNGFLGLMNVDILADQTQEIALMRWAIAAWPGDASRIVVDPSMVHGMEGMAHAGHGAAAPPAPAGHGAAAPSAHRHGAAAQPAHRHDAATVPPARPHEEAVTAPLAQPREEAVADPPAAPRAAAPRERRAAAASHAHHHH